MLWPSQGRVVPASSEMRISTNGIGMPCLARTARWRAAAAARVVPAADSEKAETEKADTEAPEPGMMTGAVPDKPGQKEMDAKLPITVFGRYLKVLLSSNEFLFVN